MFAIRRPWSFASVTTLRPQASRPQVWWCASHSETTGLRTWVVGTSVTPGVLISRAEESKSVPERSPSPILVRPRPTAGYVVPVHTRGESPYILASLWRHADR